MEDVHDDLGGTHQSAHKMSRCFGKPSSIDRSSMMINGCFNYYKYSKACKKFGDIKLVPASMHNSTIKPWLFRGGV
jgi:hypothetical protein